MYLELEHSSAAKFSEELRFFYDAVGSEILKHYEYSEDRIEIFAKDRPVKELVHDGPKLVVGANKAFSHFVFDFLSQVLLWHRMHTNGKIFYFVAKHVRLESKDHILFEKMREYGIDIEPIYDSENMFIAKEFYYLAQSSMRKSSWGFSFYTLQSLTNFIKFLNNNETPTPTKKVYVSRTRTKVRDFNEKATKYIEQYAIKDDNRLFNEAEVEELFSSLGYEIVYAEDFDNIVDQARFFWNVKVIAGTSGAGLTNVALMQDNQCLVEIDCPIVTDNGASFHTLYKQASSLKGHRFFGIPTYNYERDGINVSKNIANDKNFSNFLRNL